MIRKVKFLIFFLIFISFTSCSFSNKAGIWREGEKEKSRIAELEKEQKRQTEIIKVYTSDTISLEEIPAVKSVSLTEPKTNSSWKMSGLNLQNFVGNIHLPGINNNFLKKKNRKR